MNETYIAKSGNTYEIIPCRVQAPPAKPYKEYIHVGLDCAINGHREYGEDFIRRAKAEGDGLDVEVIEYFESLLPRLPQLIRL